VQSWRDDISTVGVRNPKHLNANPISQRRHSFQRIFTDKLHGISMRKMSLVHSAREAFKPARHSARGLQQLGDLVRREGF
jgi:hypothetical protein